MVLLGYDLGSSSVKASLVSVETGECIGSAFYPEEEMEIVSLHPGWAEQDPLIWWQNIIHVTRKLLAGVQDVDTGSIAAIGISYQMHGLVVVGKDRKPLRPSIIWCDSRAVAIGDIAFKNMGEEKCLASMLNSPGNFTASKLKWVKDHEPEVFGQTDKIMLPGDFIAMMLTGEIRTTPSGLSEGIFWDFSRNRLSDAMMDVYGFDEGLIPELTPNFSIQGFLSTHAAGELGLKPGIPLAYRAGDQPNNAFSLNVLNPGEIAATAGTSGVVYGVSDKVQYDSQSRVNTFAHVNHSDIATRLGVLLCVNGTGILNSWLKRNLGGGRTTYDEMNQIASEVSPGSDGLSMLPFGNGAERMIGNRDLGCVIDGLDFNRHTKASLIRAAHEGIVFAFFYGMKIMQQIGIEPSVIRAGHSNMFLSPIFRDSLASITGATIELYNTDGSQGAARAAGLGAGIFKQAEDAFNGLQIVRTIHPDASLNEKLQIPYTRWELLLNRKLSGESCT